MNPAADSFKCHECKHGAEEPFAFGMAFQPILYVNTRGIFAYEALVRGLEDEGVGVALERVTESNKYAFDRHCRTKAIRLATESVLIETEASLTIKFIPGAFISPVSCLRTALQIDGSLVFPLDRLIFELTETEEVRDPQRLLATIKEYLHRGLRMALNNFGASCCGLNLLSSLPVHIVKIDMDLARSPNQRATAQTIVAQMVESACKLGQRLIAEGGETVEEYKATCSCGVHLVQGYLVAKSAFEDLQQTQMPEGKVKVFVSQPETQSNRKDERRCVLRNPLPSAEKRTVLGYTLFAQGCGIRPQPTSASIEAHVTSDQSRSDGRITNERRIQRLS